MNERLQVLAPDGQVAVAVSAGDAVLLDPQVRTAVAATLRGAGAQSWQVVISGRRVRRGGLGAQVRGGLAVVARSPVASDVSVHGHLAAMVGARAARDLLRTAPLLAGRGRDPAGVLSGGERRVLAWLRARALSPRAVFLEGAGEGLDRPTLAWADEVVDTWRKAGTAILIAPDRPQERAWATPR